MSDKVEGYVHVQLNINDIPCGVRVPFSNCIPTNDAIAAVVADAYKELLDKHQIREGWTEPNSQ